MDHDNGAARPAVNDGARPDSTFERREEPARYRASPNPLPDAALTYALLGLAVFPLKERDKHPKIRKEDGGQGWKDATTDRGQIREWWRRWPWANIGLACGEAFSVLDVDLGEKGGEDTLAALTFWNGPLPRTVAAISGSGGWHFYFRHVPGWKNHIGLLPGFDIRTLGGYIVAPPSVHPCGQPYRWAKGRALGEASLEPTPAWLVEALTPSPSEPEAPPDPPAERDADGWAAERRLLQYGRAALENACREIAGAPFGQQNETLGGCAIAIGRLVGGNVIPRGVAESFLIAAGLRMVNQPGRKPWTRTQIEKEVRRCLAKGGARPRVPENRPWARRAS
jgi:hypothetical protein